LKRSELVRHLKEQGCQDIRQGGRHEVWLNPANGKTTAVPRHEEIATGTALAICRTLEVEKPRGR
jgi:predicted RNA binding protein YcfA (HicA-like mRNA interferase family)